MHRVYIVIVQLVPDLDKTNIARFIGSQAETEAGSRPSESRHAFFSAPATRTRIYELMRFRSTSVVLEQIFKIAPHSWNIELCGAINVFPLYAKLNSKNTLYCYEHSYIYFYCSLSNCCYQFSNYVLLINLLFIWFFSLSVRCILFTKQKKINWQNIINSKYIFGFCFVLNPNLNGKYC